MAQKLLLALRTITRHKREYVFATGILALGIGMSVAMFSLVDAVLLRPLPFPRQESLLVIWKANPLTGNQVEELAYPELGDLQTGIPAFESVALMPTSLYGYGKVLQTGTARPIQIESAPVSHDFFRLLGVVPVMGRDFNGSDERVGAPPVVVVSDHVWREQLSADRNVIGKSIRLNGQNHTVIGVMAPGVGFPRGAGLWTPLGITEQIVAHRGATFLQAIARLRPGQGSDSAIRQVNALFQRLAADHPEFYSRSQRAVVTPLIEYWTGSARLHLWIMMAASLLLLIAAVISSGNLLLSRTLARHAEIATCLALGATPGHILSQLAAEGALVAAIAAAGGLVIAEAAIRFLVRWAPADIPRLQEASLIHALDLRSFCFAAAVALFVAVACSIVPGSSATRTHMDLALREGPTRSASRRSNGLRCVFILSQTAVTMVLLTMAALLVLSYRSMMSADIGFAHRDAVTMNLQLRGPNLFSSRQAFYARLLNRLRESPGVTSAAAVLLRPLEGTVGWDTTYEFQFEAGRNNNRELPKGNYEVVTPGYFQTVGTPLLEGRDFDEHDSAEGDKVAIINRTLAGRIRDAGHIPLGYPIRLGLGGWAKVVGVCADARYRSVTQRGADLFVPYLQAKPPTNYLIVRGALPAAGLTGLVRRTLAGIDPNQAIAGAATIGELIDTNTARHRFNMLLLLWFGVCAAVLAASGVYSVIAGTAAARRREMAIKTALGAPRPRLVRDMVAGTLGFVAMGEAVGVCCSAALGPLTSDLLYGVSPRDPVILGWVAVFVFTVSVASACGPALAAAGADPKSGLGGTIG